MAEGLASGCGGGCSISRQARQERDGGWPPGGAATARGRTTPGAICPLIEVLNIYFLASSELRLGLYCPRARPLVRVCRRLAGAALGGALAERSGRRRRRGTAHGAARVVLGERGRTLTAVALAQVLAATAQLVRDSLQRAMRI